MMRPSRSRFCISSASSSAKALRTIQQVYLPKYAPDYWEFVNSDDSIRRCVTTESGKHFKFAFAVEDDFNITYMGLAIRQDWLDECGLKVPTNLEEWENVLVTFKDKYGATFSSPKLGF